jgi:hypothetical protein
MNFDQIMECLKKKGIDVTRSVPITDNPITFTVTEHGKKEVFREREFLEYARKRRCYDEKKEESD